MYTTSRLVFIILESGLYTPPYLVD